MQIFKSWIPPPSTIGWTDKTISCKWPATRNMQIISEPLRSKHLCHLIESIVLQTLLDQQQILCLNLFPFYMRFWLNTLFFLSLYEYSPLDPKVWSWVFLSTRTILLNCRIVYIHNQHQYMVSLRYNPLFSNISAKAWSYKGLYSCHIIVNYIVFH